MHAMVKCEDKIKPASLKKRDARKRVKKQAQCLPSKDLFFLDSM